VARIAAAVGLVALCLAGCGGGQGGNSSAAVSGGGASGNAAASAGAQGGGKVAQMVAGKSDLGRLNRLIASAGMTEVLNGVGPYTLFAPTDAAMNALGGERADALASDPKRPQAAALLRAHIVPGTLTRRDLEAAVGSAERREAKIRTMAGTMLSFSRDGDAIVVTAADGARARLVGEEGVGPNGAVQPIDGLLKKAPGQ
jgi:uncharacterized surface protein with fasciclin (FAS1) repeats